jgi:hypothetical protein
VPVQTVDATPSNTLIRQCFPGRSDLFGCPRSKPSLGSVLVDLTIASDSGLCFQCKWGSPECCIDLLKPPRLPYIFNNVGPVKHFFERTSPFTCKSFFFRFLRCFSDRPRQARFVRNLAVGSVRPKHLFDQNFDHDYFFELPLTRERDAPSSGRRFTSRHVRYRAVPRTNRTSASSSRAYQPKTARVERRPDIVMQSSGTTGTYPVSRIIGT